MKLTPWFLNFDFNGRARRSHYWANFAAWLGVWLALFVVLMMIGGAGAASESAGNKGAEAGATAGVSVVMFLALAAAAVGTVDSMAMIFRRAHDTNKSGWIWLLLLIPFVNLLGFYWLMIEDSTPGPNKYGPPVKDFYMPPSEPQAAATPATSKADELAKLATLKDNGAITDDEFAAMKAKLIS